MKTYNVEKTMNDQTEMYEGLTVKEMASMMTPMLSDGYRAEEDVMNAPGTRIADYKLEHFINFGGEKVHLISDDVRAAFITYKIEAEDAAFME